jgi:hypothetical protein
VTLTGDPSDTPSRFIIIQRIGFDIENARELVRELLPHDLERLPEAINNLIQANVELHCLQCHAEPEMDKDKKLVQTVISEELHAWLEAKAEDEGLSVAGCLRRLIIAAKENESDRVSELEARVLKLEATAKGKGAQRL